VKSISFRKSRFFKSMVTPGKARNRKGWETLKSPSLPCRN
jgi:hypothetical protein